MGSGVEGKAMVHSQWEGAFLSDKYKPFLWSANKTPLRPAAIKIGRSHVLYVPIPKVW